MYPKLFSFFSVLDVCISSYLEVYQRPENHRPPNVWGLPALQWEPYSLVPWNSTLSANKELQVP